MITLGIDSYIKSVKDSRNVGRKLGHSVLSNNVEHNEKSTIFVTTVNGFQAVREDVDWTLAGIASNTRQIIFSGSLQAVILQVLCHLHGNCNWILIKDFCCSPKFEI